MLYVVGKVRPIESGCYQNNKMPAQGSSQVVEPLNFGNTLVQGPYLV